MGVRGRDSIQRQGKETELIGYLFVSKPAKVARARSLTHLGLPLNALVARQRGLVPLLLLLMRPTLMTLGHGRVGIVGHDSPKVEPTQRSGASTAAADARQMMTPGHGRGGWRRDGSVGQGQ